MNEEAESEARENELNWTPYNTSENLQFDDSITGLIIRRLGDLKEAAKTKESQKRKGEKRTPTNLIMETLTTLGWELKYNVYSHSLSKKFRKEHKIFKHREWLYDLHWYTEHEKQRELPHVYGYRLKTLPLVVECEWKHITHEEREKCKRGECPDVDAYCAVKYDFQKLLVANANLRLMIFQKRLSPEKNAELDHYFVEAIENYIHLDRAAKCLFVRFSRSKKTFEYSKYEKKSKKDIH